MAAEIPDGETTEGELAFVTDELTIQFGLDGDGDPAYNVFLGVGGDSIVTVLGMLDAARLHIWERRHG